MEKNVFCASTIAVIESHRNPLKGKGLKLPWCIAREHPITMKNGSIAFPAAPLLTDFNEPMELHESSYGKIVQAHMRTPFILVDGQFILHQDTDKPDNEMLSQAKAIAAEFNTKNEISKETRIATLKQVKITKQVTDTLKVTDKKLWFAVAIVGSIFKEYTVVFPAAPILDENGRPEQLPQSKEGAQIEIEMNTRFNLNVELRRYPAVRDGKEILAWEAVDTGLFILRPVLGGYVDHANYQLISAMPNDDGFYGIDLPESYLHQQKRITLVDEKTYAQLESSN